LLRTDEVQTQAMKEQVTRGATTAANSKPLRLLICNGPQGLF
jgi:hypothetical protein